MLGSTHSHSHFSFADGAASPETKLTSPTCTSASSSKRTVCSLVGLEQWQAAWISHRARLKARCLRSLARASVTKHSGGILNVISTVARTCCGCVVDLISNPHVAHNITCQHDLERFLIDVLFMPSLCDLLFAWLPCIMKSATTSTNIENFNYIENYYSTNNVNTNTLVLCAHLLYAHHTI
jgi:hypothetical protein